MSEENTLEKNIDRRALSHFALSDFKASNDQMLTVTDSVYAQYGVRTPYTGPSNYTMARIKQIIDTGGPIEKRDLSRNYFYKNTVYERLVLHYAGLLTYRWFLSPFARGTKTMGDRILQKKYNDALEFLDKMGIRKWAFKFALAQVRDGCYYGLIAGETSDGVTIIDLPSLYCRNRYTDLEGNDVVEFNVQYFNSVYSGTERDKTLAQYPQFIQDAYTEYLGGTRKDPWIDIPSDSGICFPGFGNQPLLLATIPAILNYEDYTELEKTRDIEEIKKLIVQHIPHTSDGTLLFENEEAAEIHRATVNMMKHNPNHSVLTTYAEVEVVGSESVNDNVSKNNLEKILAGVYERSGTSPQVFAATGNLAMDNSLTNDLSLMMVYVEMYNTFFTSLLNRKFGTNEISFQFAILPISYYNEKEYHERVMKMTLSGYTLLLPWIALGFSQRTLVSVKDLENDVLHLTEKLIPPMNSNSMDTGTEEGGRPAKTTTEKSPKTLANEKSKDNGGQ